MIHISITFCFKKGFVERRRSRSGAKQQLTIYDRQASTSESTYDL